MVSYVCYVSVWACLQCFLEFKSLSSKTFGGTFGLFLEMRKWLGVIPSSSWGSTLTWVSSRLLSKLSISAINVIIHQLAIHDGLQSFLCWFDKSFPDSPQNEEPLDSVLQQIIWDLGLVHSIKGLLKLPFSSNEISSIVAADVSWFSSSSYHSSQRHDKAVCFEWVYNFQVYWGCHKTGEQATIALYVWSSLFD